MDTTQRQALMDVLLQLVELGLDLIQPAKLASSDAASHLLHITADLNAILNAAPAGT